MRDTLPDDYTYDIESLSGEPSKFKARLVSEDITTSNMRFFLIRTSNFRPAGLFLISWRFQPHIVLKLFLFPDISKQWITRFFFIRTSKIWPSLIVLKFLHNLSLNCS